MRSNSTVIASVLIVLIALFGVFALALSFVYLIIYAFSGWDAPG